MELDEMKKAWTDMSAAIEKQTKLTDKLIIMMTQQQYKSKLSSIGTPEWIGSALCFAMSLLILWHSNKYDTLFLQSCAVISVILLVVMPFISIRALLKMSQLNMIDLNYKETLMAFANDKKALLDSQRLNFYLGFVLLVSILPVMVKIMGGKSMPLDSSVWYWYLPFGFLFFVLFSRWVYQHYVKTTIRMSNLLRDLNDD